MTFKLANFLGGVDNRHEVPLPAVSVRVERVEQSFTSLTDVKHEFHHRDNAISLLSRNVMQKKRDGDDDDDDNSHQHHEPQKCAILYYSPLTLLRVRFPDYVYWWG